MQMRPEAEEPSFHLGDMVLVKAVEEAFEHGLLLVVEIGEVIQCMDVRDIGEHLRCVCHVLVHIVKVGQQESAPGQEPVEGLL